jgi:hypothetical protein
LPGTTPEDTTFFHNIGIGYLRWVGRWQDDLNLDLDHGFAFDQQTFAEYVAHDNRPTCPASWTPPTRT